MVVLRNGAFPFLQRGNALYRFLFLILLYLMKKNFKCTTLHILCVFDLSSWFFCVCKTQQGKVNRCTICCTVMFSWQLFIFIYVIFFKFFVLFSLFLGIPLIHWILLTGVKEDLLSDFLQSQSVCSVFFVCFVFFLFFFCGFFFVASKWRNTTTANASISHEWSNHYIVSGSGAWCCVLLQ